MGALACLQLTPSAYFYHRSGRNVWQQAAPENVPARSFAERFCSQSDRFSRAWRATKRWVTCGSRLLSHFSAQICDTEKIAW